MNNNLKRLLKDIHDTHMYIIVCHNGDTLFSGVYRRMIEYRVCGRISKNEYKFLKKKLASALDDLRKRQLIEIRR